MNPQVSIIIPNYNHTKFLQQRLDSVFNQTFQDFEVILLDDASTDNSVTVLSKYKSHPKVSHFILNKENSGSPFKQWQKGIGLAKGDCIWIAESDDYCELDFLEQCIQIFNENDSVGLVASPLVLFNNHGEIESVKVFESELHEGNFINSKFLTKGNSFYNASAVVFRKNAIKIEEISKLIHFKICGDWWLWINILKTHNLYYLDEYMCYYRKHDDATTHNLWTNHLFYNDVICLLFHMKRWQQIPESMLDQSLLYWLSKLKENRISFIAKQRLRIKFIQLLSMKTIREQAKKQYRKFKNKNKI